MVQPARAGHQRRARAQRHGRRAPPSVRGRGPGEPRLRGIGAAHRPFTDHFPALGGGAHDLGGLRGPRPDPSARSGAGCGYQAAVLAQIVREVHSIERIRGLYELARNHLRALRLTTRIRLIYGDGTVGLPGVSPFDAIVGCRWLGHPAGVAAAARAGRTADRPEGSTSQRLVLIERTGAASWKRTELEAVRFVPLRAGIQS